MQHIEISQKHQNAIIFIFIALPIFSLFLNAISWLKFGINIPYWDDWEVFKSGNIGNLSWSFLFSKGNDSLYPVGRFLDALFNRYLNNNVIAYQFISLIAVLGALLFLQWRLLFLVLKDRLLTASAFVLTLFMLQPDTYWGAQYIAYHQALPLVFSLSAIYIILGMRWNPRWSPFILIVLGLLSGFSYISGSFSILTLSFIFICASAFIQSSEHKPLLHGGLALLGSSLITVPTQVWVLAVIQKGTHRADMPMAYPFEIDFWLYFLGKIGRALMLPSSYPWISFIMTLLVVFTIISLIIWLIRQFTKGNLRSLSESRGPLIFIAFSAMIFIYLCMVSAGRANHYPAGVTSIVELFSFGFPRFHFFWATLLWPWLAAVIFMITSKIVFSKKINLASVLAIVMPIIIVPYLLLAGAFKHDSAYKRLSERFADGVNCIITHIQANQGINCIELYPGDITTAVINAQAYHASFMNTIPFAPLSFDTHASALLLYSSKTTVNNIEFKNAEVLTHNENIFNMKTAVDPMVFLETDHPEKMNLCKILEVSVQLKVSNTDIVQVFYLPKNQAGFSEASSKTASVEANGQYNKIHFQLSSPNGFANKLRLDPVTSAQNIELKNIEIKCGYSS